MDETLSRDARGATGGHGNRVDASLGVLVGLRLVGWLDCEAVTVVDADVDWAERVFSIGLDDHLFDEMHADSTLAGWVGCDCEGRRVSAVDVDGFARGRDVSM